MKKKILSFILLPTIFLASCNLSSNQNEINIIYQDKSEESIDYDKGLKSSFAVKNEETGTYSGTVIEYTNNKYYGLSSSDLGSINANVVIYENSKTVDAKIIGLDTKNNLSLLEFSGDSIDFSLPTIEYEYLKGETIYTVSTPLSQSKNEIPLNSITKGYLSRIDSIYLASDASLNSSSYGCGFYNQNGALLGIFTSKIDSDLKEKEYIQGMSSALKMEYVMKSYNQMKTSGEVKRTTIGITVTEYHKSLNDLQAQMYPSEIYSKIKVPDLERVYCVVLNVDSKKNNVDGLIEAGDIIISCNDEEIIHNSDISKVLSFAQIGDKLTFKIKRYNSQTKEFDDFVRVITLTK